MKENDYRLYTPADDSMENFYNRNQSNPDGGKYVRCVTVTAGLTIIIVIVTLWLAGFLILPASGDIAGWSYDREGVGKLLQIVNTLNREFYETPDEDRMYEYAVRGAVMSVNDPYTVYYSKDEMTMLMERSEGSFVGIGVYVQQGEGGHLLVTDVFSGSPAEEAGVLAGDEIVSVDGTSITDIPSVEEAIEMIKGAEGSSVLIGLYRRSEDLSFEVKIIRAAVKTENIISRLIEEGDNVIGYIRIVMFDNHAVEYFKSHLDKLLESQIAALIVDVRDNTGGSYDSVVGISDILIGDGVIVYTEDRQGKQDYKYSDEDKLELPLVILTNKNSASASEILAGAVKDHEAGILVGERTFGKGLVQAIVTLRDGSGLKYTKSRYFTPSGVCIDGEGIEPDIVVLLPQEFNGVSISDIPFEQDTQLETAIESFGF